MEEEEANKAAERVTETVDDGQKRTWSSYIPSMRRGPPKHPEQKESERKEVDEQEEKSDDSERKDKLDDGKILTGAT